MNDTIDRQQAIDATWKEVPYTDPLNILTEIRDRIKALPSVQSEIIRCRNCRYNDGTAYCEMHYRDVKGSDFCSWGER